MKRFSITLAAAALVCASEFSSQAATPDFNADITSQNTVRLFLGPGTNAPNGTDIWFIADKNGDGLGLGASNSLVDISVITGWAGQAGENLLVFGTDSAPGQLAPIPGNIGKYSRLGVTIPASLGIDFSDNRPVTPVVSNTKVWAVLWNDSTGGDVGDVFGILELSITPVPAVGNATWTIGSAIFANQYTVTAVPEPSTYALLGLGALGVLGYRRFKK